MQHTTYDFDRVTDRRGSGALKTDALAERYGDASLLPMWVADMDFETPPFIMDALRRRLEHPVLGYTVEHPDWRASITDWERTLHGWEIRPEWLAFVPGIVKGIGMAVNALTRPGDGVIIQPPVYHPFGIVTRLNGRRTVENPLRRKDDGSYEMDLEHLERVAPQSRLMILSNPHNPAGVVWSDYTLKRVAEICHRHGVTVVSDEIHADMALFGHRHTPFASVSGEARRISITFGAPSKTFNMAGVVSSWAAVPDDGLRRRFFGWMNANELADPDIFAPIAAVAAYREGAEWRRQMLAYVEDNILFTERYCEHCIPGVRPLRPQASFLVWLDCRGLGLDHDALVDLFTRRAGLALNDGEMFGPGGEGYMRLNVGCPRPVLREALDRLRRAADGMKESRP